MTPKQREMLLSFKRDGEATDICDFDWRTSFGHLAWMNRERVIDACRRRGWLDDNGITEAGLAALGMAADPNEDSPAYDNRDFRN